MRAGYKKHPLGFRNSFIATESYYVQGTDLAFKVTVAHIPQHIGPSDSPVLERRVAETSIDYNTNQEIEIS